MIVLEWEVSPPAPVLIVVMMGLRGRVRRRGAGVSPRTTVLYGLVETGEHLQYSTTSNNEILFMKMLDFYELILLN